MFLPMVTEIASKYKSLDLSFGYYYFSVSVSCETFKIILGTVVSFCVSQ